MPLVAIIDPGPAPGRAGAFVLMRRAHWGNGVHRQHRCRTMQTHLTQDQITHRIDELSAAASARMRACAPEFAATMGGAAVDFMSAEERSELYSLQLQQPTFAELRDQAQDRIAARIASRKNRSSQANRTPVCCG